MNTIDTIDSALQQMEQELCSMVPERISNCEGQLHDVFAQLRSQDSLHQSEAEQLANCTKRLEILLSRAAHLYSGWIQIFASATSGYTAAGTAALPKHLGIVTEG